ncbi:hypothetical protein SCHPADRAFT_201633 [Schizopora paradoxa]|uniref:Uncharacterized protein n=1 Tax=Schizopora paradoxa TaxID=27342 RepID=A0A0H2SHU1_9AGAM|nr:hypothetical protein SCHPADRAFT_201633 [Schizopora paradoxa]
MFFGFGLRRHEGDKDGVAKGEYAVVGPRIERKPRLSSYRDIVPLAPIIACLIFGTGLMLAHHLFYTYLNEKIISPSSLSDPISNFLMEQRNVNFVGTSIAHGARILLAMAIGITFTQWFWKTIRSTSHTITQIDAILNCGQSPFHPSAYRAAKASSALYAISLAVSATAFIVILSPGSLTILTGFQQQIPCLVPIVPQLGEITADVYGDTYVENIDTILKATLLSNSYLPPYRGSESGFDMSGLCGSLWAGLQSCSYNLSIAGPTLTCVDVSLSTDFTSFLTPHSREGPSSADFNSTLELTTIWNATVHENLAAITILSRDLEKGLIEAINCSAYNATYNLGVSFEGNLPAKIQVRSVDGDSVPLQINTFSDFYAKAALNAISGMCFADNSETGAMTCNTTLGPLIAATATGNFTFSDNITHFAESFVQNASISLLSGSIYYDSIYDEYAFNTTTFDTEPVLTEQTCLAPTTIYSYNPIRLISAYCVPLAIAVSYVIYGCRLILQSGIEHELRISDIIKFAINSDIIHVGKTSNKGDLKRVEIQFSGADSGQQKLFVISARTFAYNDLQGPSESDRRHQEPTKPVLWKMPLLVLGILLTMILNHAYYHFLHGKLPNRSWQLSHPTAWLLNQTIKSDIGTALAYLGQTFLAIGIGISSKQIFWRIIRQHRHSISGIDSLMRVENNLFSPSIISAIRVSRSVPFLVLLATSASLVSIFAPGSIKIAEDFKEVKDCTALVPQNHSTPSSRRELTCLPSMPVDHRNALTNFISRGQASIARKRRRQTTILPLFPRRSAVQMWLYSRRTFHH